MPCNQNAGNVELAYIDKLASTEDLIYAEQGNGPVGRGTAPPTLT